MSRLGPTHYSKEQIRSAFEKGFIDSDECERRIAALDRAGAVSDSLADRTYPFVNDAAAIDSDLSDGIIDPKHHRIFSWFAGNGGIGDGSDIISFRLKISVLGLKLLGRFDTFECCMRNGEDRMEHRLYCVNGTLFEGCGNFRAPDAGKYTGIPYQESERIFGYLAYLFDNGYMGKDHGTASGFDSDEFHLYVRFKGIGTVHTKGTSEFPEFFGFLLYLLGAEIIV